MTHSLGEFEHLLLLALMNFDEGATALDVRRVLEERANRPVSRGALYATLDRLEEKGWIAWEAAESVPDRGGIPARTAIVTREGHRTVAEHHAVLRRLSRGLRLLPDEP